MDEFHLPLHLKKRLSRRMADEQRIVIKQINILDETEGEYAYRAQPYTFVLHPDLRIHAIYNGWYFVGRPTSEELRRDLRAMRMARRHSVPMANRLRRVWWAGSISMLGLA